MKDIIEYGGVVKKNGFMKKCKVVHHRKEPYDVYIARPSKWGNPFSHKFGTRAEFILPTRKEAVGRWIQHQSRDHDRGNSPESSEIK